MKAVTTCLFVALAMSALAAEKLIDEKLAARAEVVLRVKRITPGEGSKFMWYQVEVLQVFKNQSSETFTNTFSVAAYSWKDGVPEGESTLYLERYNKIDKTLWMLVGGEASTGVSHVKGPQRPQLAPYEIVLEGEHVVFKKAEKVSIRIMVRNLGMKRLVAPDLYWGLSVVWDGKEYKRDLEKIGDWSSPSEIPPKTAWRAGFSLSEYLVPLEVLSAGRHTIALKDAFAESNTLRVFIEKTSVREAAWGEPLDGVSVRLRADKTKWASTETPTFKFEVRNQGKRYFSIVQSQETGRLEVDGVWWYGWAGGFDLKGSGLPPWREYHDIPVSLGSNWKATQDWRDKSQAPPPQTPLKLLAGKHTIRFTAEIRDLTVKPKPQISYVPSNPVEIEITSDSQVKVPLTIADISEDGRASAGGDLNRPQFPPYEIVLEGEKVVFDKVETVSSHIFIRNLGVKKLIAPELYWGLSVVWDGKKYERDPKYTAPWNGPREIIPQGAMFTGISLSEYLVPVAVLTAGRHTIVLKDAFAESNTLTVFIEPKDR